MNEEKKTIRCAIYTRKSTSEGLDQDFTTLDAQRDAGLNYIKSQKSEGWIVLPSKYDDGGFTGANLDRPALQQLLSDIKAGGIDCVVVYKVDRLSRSLLDFTKLLEFFEQHSVTFVSVTQAFNTNTSMGRLTLNILLSFAQFEREMISERTRDKMAAAKKKGRWTGGIPMLGYAINKEKKALVINEEEAKTVRLIFELYLKHKSLLAVTKELNERKLAPRHLPLKNGETRGVAGFNGSIVHRILKNPVYTGRVLHKGSVYDGLHDAIIDMDTFNNVQEILSANYRKPENPVRQKHTGLLSGIIFCRHCSNAMIYTYAKKKGRMYRYYLCTNAQKRGWDACKSPSVNAHLIESKVENCLRQVINNVNQPFNAAEASPPACMNLSKIFLLNSYSWDVLFIESKRQVLQSIVEKVVYEKEKLNIVFKDSFVELLRKRSVKYINNSYTFYISQNGAKTRPKPVPVPEEPVSYLKKQLALAWQLQSFTERYQTQSTAGLCKYLPICKSRICRILKTLNLAPKIQEQIILSTNPAIAALTERNINKIILQNDWDKQYEMWKELLKE